MSTIENVEEFTDQQNNLHVINTRKTVFIDRSGKKYLVGTIRNITAQIKLQHQLEEAKQSADLANKTKGEFLANMSHEIRTPLNAILGLTELMLNSSLSGKERTTYLRAVLTSGQSLLTVLNDVLDISKLEARKLTLASEQFSLHALISDISTLFSVPTKAKNIILSTSLIEPLPDIVLGDPNRIRQVLTNLLSNAFKFTNDRGNIQLLCGPAKETSAGYAVKFKVIDSGIGIKAAQLQLIFEAFQQGDMSPTRNTTGTGLGLTISRQLVELMGGEICVNSKKGYGSEFEFFVNLGNPELIPACNSDNASSISTELQQARAIRVLVVEDNKNNQLLMRGILEHAGQIPLMVENGEEALQFLENNSVDIVLMDLEMPVMDGYSATKAIRESLRSYASVPIIALTAHVHDESAAKCRAAGMNNVITKPFSRQKLLKAIQDSLKHSAI